MDGRVSPNSSKCSRVNGRITIIIHDKNFYKSELILEPMKSLKLIVMTGIILATSVGISSGENSSTRYTSSNEYGKNTRNSLPQERENKYPERFPASVRAYDFTRLNSKRASKL